MGRPTLVLRPPMSDEDGTPGSPLMLVPCCVLDTGPACTGLLTGAIRTRVLQRMNVFAADCATRNSASKGKRKALEHRTKRIDAGSLVFVAAFNPRRL